MMQNYAWGEIEDAVVAALEAELGERVQTVSHHQGDWRDDLDRGKWRLPAVLVRVDGGRAEQVGVGSYDFVLELSVLVITRDLRGEAHGRRGDRGAYGLAQAVREALWHRDLGLEILPLALVEERPRVNNAEYTAYALRFKTGWVYAAAAGQ
jgi:phage gp37-like protein